MTNFNSYRIKEKKNINHQFLTPEYHSQKDLWELTPRKHDAPLIPVFLTYIFISSFLIQINYVAPLLKRV